MLGAIGGDEAYEVYRKIIAQGLYKVIAGEVFSLSRVLNIKYKPLTTQIKEIKKALKRLPNGEEKDALKRECDQRVQEGDAIMKEEMAPIQLLKDILIKIATVYPLIDSTDYRHSFAMTQDELEEQRTRDVTNIKELLDNQLKVFAGDSQQHLGEAIKGNVFAEEVRKQGKPFKEIASVFVERVLERMKEHHLVATRGALAYFRGNIGVDCSKHEKEHGGPVFHTVDWNNMYWVGEGGYIGTYDLRATIDSTESEPEEEDVTILGLDTINGIPTYLVPDLFAELEVQAQQMGYLGVAIPRVIAGSFNYPPIKSALRNMSRYQQGLAFRGEARFQQAKKRVDDDKGEDKWHAINLKDGDFVLLIPDVKTLGERRKKQLRRFLLQEMGNDMQDRDKMEALKAVLKELETTPEVMAAAQAEWQREAQERTGLYQIVPNREVYGRRQHFNTRPYAYDEVEIFELQDRELKPTKEKPYLGKLHQTRGELVNSFDDDPSSVSFVWREKDRVVGSIVSGPLWTYDYEKEADQIPFVREIHERFRAMPEAHPLFIEQLVVASHIQGKKRARIERELLRACLALAEENGYTHVVHLGTGLVQGDETVWDPIQVNDYQGVSCDLTLFVELLNPKGSYYEMDWDEEKIREYEPHHPGEAIYRAA